MNQIAQQRRIFDTVKATGILFPLVFLSAIFFQPWVEPKWMFLDPLTAAELSGDCCHTYYGFISTTGVMLWTASAAVSLFCAIMLWLFHAPKAAQLFNLLAGLLTAWLALDDAFLVHEVVLPSFGIPQTVVVGGYALLALAYIATCWRIILQHDYVLFLLAGFCLAASLFIDQIFHSLLPGLVYLEDSSKFLGICFWATFHINAGLTLTFRHCARS